MTEPRKWTPPDLSETTEVVEVLIPGTHKQEHEDPVEVGTDDFVTSVLDHLPEDVLYRMGELGRCAIGTIEGERGHKSFVEVDDVRLRTILDAHIRFISKKSRRVKQDDGTTKAVHTIEFVPCSKDLAALVRSFAANSPKVREIRQIAHTPVYLPGWSLALPGWNPEGRVYLDTPPTLDGLVPKAEGAPEVLRDLLVDYPFKNQASRENAFALLVTRIVRPALKGTTPFFWWMASLERTGKGKGIDACNLATAGETMPVMQVGRTEEEREKRLTSLILRGADAIHLDNIPHGEEFDSPSVASLATAYPSWSGRVLGGSTVVVLPNNLLVCVSANNPKATGEIAKRSVPIVLESKTATPELRDDFVHPDPVSYPLAQRRAVLEALLGMVEAWKKADRPQTAHRFGGFERWTSAVGGIMRLAGCESFLANRVEWVRTANDDIADADALVSEWSRIHGFEPVQAKALFSIVESNDLFGSTLQSAKTDKGRLTVFGRKVLGSLIDKPLPCGFIVRKCGDGSHALYALSSSVM